MPKPNIVWLTSDHIVYANHKRFSGYPQLPAYDRICHEGICFDNAVSVSPVCTPARGSMLTGVYPHRHGLTQNDGGGGCRLEFEQGQKLFNHHMKQEGYRTGFFGKWHCGEKRIAKDYGFEGFSCPGYGHPYWSDEYHAYLDEMGLPQAEVTVEWKFGDPSWTGKTIRLNDFPKPYRSPYFLMESCGRLNTPLETHEAYFLSHLARTWLEEVSSEDKPFCMRLDMWGPHLPYWVGEPFLDTIDPKSLAPYPNFGSSLSHRPKNHRDLLDYRRREGSSPDWKDWQPILARCHEHATMVDAAMDQIVTALNELGLAENTILVYTTDHGGTMASNGELVDKGWLMVEETMRIPMAIRWPGHIDPGEINGSLVSNMDLVPTILEAAGARLPDPLDGRSLFDLMQFPETTPWQDDLMLQHHGHYDEIHFQRQLRFNQFKYTAHLRDSDELYDLSRDPYELNNLWDEPGMKPVLKEAQQRLIQWMVSHEDNSDHSKQLIAQISG